jgi:hypothetical protein
MVLLETFATAAREYGSVPFHFANDALWLPRIAQGAEGAAKRLNKRAHARSSATQEGASERFVCGFEATLTRKLVICGRGKVDRGLVACRRCPGFDDARFGIGGNP